MAAGLGIFWFSDRNAPDEVAATRPAHAAVLGETLVRHGHMTAAARPAPARLMAAEPLEAELGRHAVPAVGDQAPARQPNPSGPHVWNAYSTLPHHQASPGTPSEIASPQQFQSKRFTALPAPAYRLAPMAF